MAPPNPAAETNGAVPPDSAVARRRRDEIVSSATDIIAGEGLHRLSLARIEQRTGMTRGQLTYYFPAKESILLAVFDRMLDRMIAAARADMAAHNLPEDGPAVGWERLRHGLGRLLGGRTDGPEDTLGPLVHTFMAQVQHRPDYKAKLAAANAGWRQMLAADLAAGPPGPVPPAVAASVVMALFQGLGGQLAVDPGAFDRTAMLHACLLILAPLFGHPPGAGHD
jgi:AcrR family transcriptional regulator